MDRLTALRLFLRTLDRGGIAAAGRGERPGVLALRMSSGGPGPAGARQLCSVSALPELGWYGLVFVQAERILGLADFLPMIAVTLASLLATENGPRLEEGFNQFTASGFRTMVLELFALFSRARETLSENDPNGEILDVLRRSSELAQLEQSGQLTDEEANPLWIQNALRLAQIRAAILTPAQ